MRSPSRPAAPGWWKLRPARKRSSKSATTFAPDSGRRTRHGPSLPAPPRAPKLRSSTHRNGTLPGLCPAAQNSGREESPADSDTGRHRGQHHFSRGDGRRLTPVPLPSPAVTPKESLRSRMEYDGARIAGPPHASRKNDLQSQTTSGDGESKNRASRSLPNSDRKSHIPPRASSIQLPGAEGCQAGPGGKTGSNGGKRYFR